MYQPYGVPVMTQAPLTAINPFYGFGAPAFHAGHVLQPSLLPQAVNHYQPPMPMLPISPGHQYLHPYGNIQPQFYPHGNWQSTIPPHPSFPPGLGPERNISGPSRRRRSLSPVLQTEGPSGYRELGDWLNEVDRDSHRGRWGHQFSQFSAAFELAGFKSLLDLEDMTTDTLFGMTGMDEIAADRLLRFAREDIGEIRANALLRPKRMKYSY